MSTEHRPFAVESDTLSIAGVPLRVFTLDDGRRIVDADDVAALFEALASGAEITEREAATLAFWVDGGRHPGGLAS